MKFVVRRSRKRLLRKQRTRRILWPKPGHASSTNSSSPHMRMTKYSLLNSRSRNASAVLQKNVHNAKETSKVKLTRRFASLLRSVEDVRKKRQLPHRLETHTQAQKLAENTFKVKKKTFFYLAVIKTRFGMERVQHYSAKYVVVTAVSVAASVIEWCGVVCLATSCAIRDRTHSWGEYILGRLGNETLNWLTLDTAHHEMCATIQGRFLHPRACRAGMEESILLTSFLANLCLQCAPHVIAILLSVFRCVLLVMCCTVTLNRKVIVRLLDNIMSRQGQLLYKTASNSHLAGRYCSVCHRHSADVTRKTMHLRNRVQ